MQILLPGEHLSADGIKLQKMCLTKLQLFKLKLKFVARLLYLNLNTGYQLGTVSTHNRREKGQKTCHNRRENDFKVCCDTLLGH